MHSTADRRLTLKDELVMLFGPELYRAIENVELTEASQPGLCISASILKPLAITAFVGLLVVAIWRGSQKE